MQCVYELSSYAVCMHESSDFVSLIIGVRRVTLAHSASVMRTH